MAHTNVQLVSGNLTTGGNDPTFYVDRVNNKVGIGEVPETSGDDSSNVLQVNGSMLATKYHGDGSSLTGLNDSKWLEYSGDASKIYYNGGNVGIGTASPSSKLTVNEIPTHRGTYDHSLAPMTITNRTPTSNSTLNDPQHVLNLAREGTTSQAYGARATFKLSRYEDVATHSRTRLDLNLAHDSYNEPQIMTFRSDGNVGIGTTDPRDPLTVRPAATTGEGIHSGICIDHDTAHAGAQRGLVWHNTNQDFEMGAIRMEVGSGYNSCKMSFFTSASKATAIERMTLDHSGNLVASGDVTASSDRRLKTDIKRIEGALNKVRTLGGYTFTKNDNLSTGLIAQEVLEVLPEAVHGTEETYYSIAYGNMVGILIEAIKELSDEVKELKEKIG